jgi:hypothetical protein
LLLLGPGGFGYRYYHSDAETGHQQNVKEEIYSAKLGPLIPNQKDSILDKSQRQKRIQSFIIT